MTLVLSKYPPLNKLQMVKSLSVPPLYGKTSFPSPFWVVGIDALQITLNTVMHEVRFLAYP